jgi:hypothetical protein
MVNTEQEITQISADLALMDTGHQSGSGEEPDENAEALRGSQRSMCLSSVYLRHVLDLVLGHPLSAHGSKDSRYRND